MSAICYKNLDNHSNSTVSDYFALLKPRVMSLVVFTSFAGMILAPGELHPLISFVSIICIAIGAGASGAINMWYDRDIDSIMHRTRNRPIVTGKISPNDALYFGVILSFFSSFIMAICVNYLSALLLLVTISFYVFIYTIWLKRSTVQNIVIGGASGAFPPMIGWASVTGEINFDSFLLFLLIFMWTPPHFWALALYRSDDYRRSNVPMMPVVYGDDITKVNIIFYTILTFLVSLTLYYTTNLFGYLYLVVSSILGSLFLYFAFSLVRDKNNKLAPRMFKYSVFYLFAIFAVMIIDHSINAVM